MSNKYTHLLSPIKIGSKTLKNRMMSSKCSVNHKSYEEEMRFFTALARAGAATVVIDPGGYPDRSLEYFPNGDPVREFRGLDLNDESVRERVRVLTGAMHDLDTLAFASLMGVEYAYVGIADIPNFADIPAHGDYSQMLFDKPAATTQQLEKMIEEFAWRAKDFKSLGFDGCTVYMSYRASLLALSLSPLYNLRTDRFGGKTMKERATLTLELFRAIKDACGKDFIIEMQISGEEEAPGYTVEDWLDYCEECVGLVDVIQVRGYDGSSTHVSGLNCEKGNPPNSRFSAAFKERGIPIPIAPIGGFGDAGAMEKLLVEGKADLFSMARRFISDSEYIAKLEAGDTENITPCLLCNKCHGPSPSCAVNPRVANGANYPAPEKSKKVAVVGGGPAGMFAAITAAERGHAVTLYESKDKLGGQLNAAAVPSWKWPVKDYLAYLATKTERAGVNVKLNTSATAETLAAEKYDAIIAAAGSSAQLVPAKIAAYAAIWEPEAVFADHTKLGHKVVVIGGQSTGYDVSLYLAQQGHEVVMVTRRQAAIFHDNHAQRAEEDFWNSFENLSYIEHAETKEIGKDYVKLTVKEGIPRQVVGFPATGLVGIGYVVSPDVPASWLPENSSIQIINGRFAPNPYNEENMTLAEKTVSFDSVVVCGGRAPNADVINSLSKAAPEFYVIGDGEKAGDIKNCTSTAYAAAMSL